MSNTPTPTLPEGWQPGDICGYCDKILLTHRFSDHACLNALICDNPTHAHIGACWNVFSSFIKRNPGLTPLYHRCGRSDGPHDCVTEAQERGDLGGDDR